MELTVLGFCYVSLSLMVAKPCSAARQTRQDYYCVAKICSVWSTSTFPSFAGRRLLNDNINQQPDEDKRYAKHTPPSQNIQFTVPQNGLAKNSKMEPVVNYKKQKSYVKSAFSERWWDNLVNSRHWLLKGQVLEAPC